MTEGNQGKEWLGRTGREESGQEVSQVEVVETAVVRIRPGLDVGVIAFQEEALRLLEYARRRIIASQADVKVALDDLTTMAKLKKAIEERRVEYVKPLNDHVMAINANFKLVSGPVLEADAVTRKKVLDWQNEQERQRREAEELARMQAEINARAAQLSGDIATGEIVEVVAPPPEIAKTTFTETGSASRSKVRKYRIVDEGLIPREYMIPDTAKIQRVVKAGIPNIPGIEIWEEATLQVRSR